ncbi:MAG: hypothetical protein HY603_01370 [Parcubacteria group bacterium]|nr:hypothetical protein [Parcubacteria group bacterium]
MKIGVIGPTDLKTLAVNLGQSEDWVRERIDLLGKMIAEAGHELWVNPDGGVLAAVANAYKAHGGSHLVMLVPMAADPWPNDHTHIHAQIADEVRKLPSWFHANYAVVSEVDICICAGRSVGTFSELAYARWDEKFKTGVLQKLFAVRELLLEGKLPYEYSQKFGARLHYVDTIEGLSFKKE